MISLAGRVGVLNNTKSMIRMLCISSSSTTTNISNNNIYYKRSLSTSSRGGGGGNNEIDSKQGDDKPSVLSKELRELGVYLPEEMEDAYYEEEFEEEDDEEIDGEDEEVDKSQGEEDDIIDLDKKKKNELTEQEYRMKKLLDMVKLQEKHNPVIFEQAQSKTYEELQAEWEEQQYQKKVEALNKIDFNQEFIVKDTDRSNLFDTVNNQFTAIDRSNNQIQFKNDNNNSVNNNNNQNNNSGNSSSPRITSRRQHFNQLDKSNDDLPDVDISRNDDLSTRLSKIKNKLAKDKMISGRLNVEELSNFYELYRTDPQTNNSQSLADKYSITNDTAQQLLKYYSVPVIVKYNTGTKSAHWSVTFEQ
ncbi:hypothetical protein DFA_08102 [Cavenderia fasciculata]|uniref:Uncharacterized protein n=1 Tax=Cavenderia fasciculata TaxID=261658 RepID=F4Q561_CACFS|nr:uncharacterized protein DFA_08102 [Cavenderia fasciculata]EGG17120.1 hypothetical protein DFA_08102 [Cavenderia fasciculata]|eukprot:XP_004355604.1 hypothetical protein DFA_08102 [Cavenderia fasciculata]